MKKLFICVMTSLCSTFAFADADLVVKPATISGGNGTMEVVIYKANTTAFQFDVALPAGVSATGFSLAGAPATRKFEKALYNAETNTWRFLTYDEGNAALDASTTFNITLAATDAATGGEAGTEGILLVDPEGESTTVSNGTAEVSIAGGEVTITLSEIGSATFVSNKDLDFSSLTDVKAYICSGYDVSTDNFMFTRVKDVPKNTPIYVRGPKNYSAKIPVSASSITYYGDNFLVGNATEDVVVPAETDEILCWALSKSQGFVGVAAGRTLDPGKAYLRLPKQVQSNVKGSDVDIKMSQTGNLAYVGEYDLDFSAVSGLKAYIVSGFDKNAHLLLSNVKKVVAGTPLYLKGTSNQLYSVASSSNMSMAYANMLRGSAVSTSVVPKESGDYVNWIYSKGGGKWGPLASDQDAFPKGTAYLPLLKSYASENATVRGMESNSPYNVVEVEAEVIYVKAGSLDGVNDGTVGIRSIDEGQFTNDIWYNLNGQRIDTPTKKGLYIKNGKKVLVK